jgi:tetratricopeptide (TPR) repeat protein
VNGPRAKIALTFETPSGERVKRDIGLESAREDTASGNVPYMWASMKIESLEGEYDLNRGEIRRLGREFGIPTRETSLLVLETVEDYARYDIDPPSELKPEFDRLRASAVPQRGNENKLKRVISEWKSRVDWWEKDFPKGPLPRHGKEPGKGAGGWSLSGSISVEESGVNALRDDGNSDGEIRISDRLSAVPSAPRQTAPMSLDGAFSEIAREAGEDARDAGSAIVIGLRPWSPDEPYIRRMRDASGEDLYRVYLDERPDYENSPSFFIDVSYQLSERGFEELSLRVMSNLAEMNLENRHILRVLGYRLLEAGRAEQAVVIFKQALALADDEPQSYRDLALARDAAGDKQSAVEGLYEVAERDFERAFPGIETIALAEMNAIIASSPKPLDTAGIDPRLIGNYPLDLRVVLAWDTDNTDVDLHVIDPNGEEAFYGAPLSYQGGRVSPDNTVGYGPEEYSLRKAKPGIYRIEVNFYANGGQLISEATTVQLDFFTHYGEKTQKKESVTMRLREAKDRIFVGEFEVK